MLRVVSFQEGFRKDDNRFYGYGTMSLTGPDYQALSSRWIDLPTAEIANIQRIDHLTGREYTGNQAKDLAGLWIPYFEPGNGIIIGGRVRRDHPEIKVKPDGSKKEDNKYINAPGFRHIYVPPGVSKIDLANTTLPVVIAEGEFKALAALRLARYNSPQLRFLPLGIAGAYNWSGKIGKIESIDGTQVDEKGILPDFHLLEWVNRKVILAFDCDPDRIVASKVRNQRNQLRQHLLAMGAGVADLEWPITLVKKGSYGNEALRNGVQAITAKGLDDWLARDGPEIVLTAIAALEYRDKSDWRSKLLASATTGMPKALVHNAILALQQSPQWSGVLRFDVFERRLTATRRPWTPPKVNPHLWKSTDSTHLASWFQEQKIEVGIDTAASAASAAAEECDSLSDFIESCEWDGTPRIDRWLIDYMAVKTTNPEGEDITNYVCAAGAAWLIGGVGRALQPGCQMDYALVFCGGEGIGKSTGLKALSNGWYTDSLTSIHGDEAMMKLQGRWIVEFREIAAFGKAEAHELRGFISSPSDDYRAKYARDVENHPRRVIFAGTTNKQWFLDPDSEDRRYWPVMCIGTINVAGLRLIYKQLWAEAKERWQDGAKPYISDPSIVQQALTVREGFKKIEHPWTETIQAWLDRTQGEEISIDQILSDAIKKEKGQLKGTDTVEVASILRRLGYENFKSGKKRLSRWRIVDKLITM